MSQATEQTDLSLTLTVELARQRGEIVPPGREADWYAGRLAECDAKARKLAATAKYGWLMRR